KKRQKRAVTITNKELLDDYKFFSSSIWLKHRYRTLVRNGNKCQCCGTVTEVVDVYSQDIKTRLSDFNFFLRSLQVLCKLCAHNQNLDKIAIQTKTSPIIRRAKAGVKGFYNSLKWIGLRNQAFANYGLKCHCCRESEGQ